jgi:hypothetical protein
MNCKTLLTFCSCVLGLIAPATSEAHFLWASLDPATKTVAIGLQEVPSQEPLPLGTRADQVKGWLYSGRALRLKAEGNWFKASTSNGCVGASLDYGVIDRRDGGRGVFWLKYYAKGCSTLGASQTRLNLPVELSATQTRDGRSVVTVLQNGKPTADADLVVEDATGKTSFEGKSGADGTAILPASSGPLEVRALITDPTPGTQAGKPYDLIRSYSTLTVRDTSAKSLTRLLRESFGNMHDVVSNTAFINTVMAGTLTKPQLEAHLQQRALIHDEVDRVLRRARIDPLLYGDPQKEVIPLLRDNLKAMGSVWPAPSEAWPLTQGLLAEIRESAKQGPYFALGVFHVYYGGITHGGRDIGAMIDHQLNTSLGYYEKSGGYDDYAREVDTITDPEAQREMIRGGNEAYRYIIAVNDLQIFKTLPAFVSRF